MKSKCCLNKKILTQISQTANFLKIIAEKNRLKILCSLQKGERCVCDIRQDLAIPQNLVSHHLKVLKQAGLINSQKKGLNMIYSINKKQLREFNLLLKHFLQKYE
ncbi:metalloregulator ArsR/SmtB family transcription factor [Patescibacteria group bacterium]|nr:metalloregulator ArsR/SmtB family transcription factor [Patescibacteria group bacterium]